MTMQLDAAEAGELVELLQFLADWLARDRPTGQRRAGHRMEGIHHGAG